MKDLVKIDKQFFDVINDLRTRNQINLEKYEMTNDHVNKALAKKHYLLDLATGFQVEAEFFENAAKIYEIQDELFREGGLLDQLEQSEAK